MLSVHLIQRHFQTHRYDALLGGVAANGLTMPLPLEARLHQGPCPAVALGLRRLVELTYGPTSLSRAMTDFLLDQQAADGSFDQDPLATACAVAALGRVAREHPQLENHEAVHQAYQRALYALADMQSHDTDHPGFRHPDDHTRQDRDLTTSFILALLAGDSQFRGMVRFAEIVDDLEQRLDDLDTGTRHLWLLAQLDATPAGSPAHASIAA